MMVADVEGSIGPATGSLPPQKKHKQERTRRADTAQRVGTGTVRGATVTAVADTVDE